ncbi:hypothetical protein B4900_08105 [Yersinia rohdei]|nr:hypothetical protein B4900_08105 [Yersinia rohdei]
MSSPPTRRARRLPDVCPVSHKQALKATNYRIHRINLFGTWLIYIHNRVTTKHCSSLLLPGFSYLLRYKIKANL